MVVKAVLGKPALGLVLAGIGGFAAIGSLAGEIITVAASSTAPVDSFVNVLAEAGALGVLVLVVGLFVWKDSRRDGHEIERDKKIARALDGFSKAVTQEGLENRKAIKEILEENRKAFARIFERIIDRGGDR